MSHIFQLLIDFIFPPNKEELRIRWLSPQSFSKEVAVAPKPELPFISSIFAYKDPLVRELIWQIKYKKNKRAIKCAGFALYNWLQDQNIKDGILIPIPISRKRRKERGFNQCELLIDEIMTLDILERFIKNYHLLIRSKNIDKQTLKNRDERIENTKNIFRVTEKSSNNAKIIIIDDVSTTGSTLKEARDALIMAGYVEVLTLSLAH